MRDLLVCFACLISAGCDIIPPGPLVYGFVAESPEIRYPGQFDVAAKTTALAFIEHADLDRDPVLLPIRGAQVSLTFTGTTVALIETSGGEDAAYRLESSEAPQLRYVPYADYVFSARVPGGSPPDWGVDSPPRLDPASISVVPTPQMSDAFPGATKHARGAELTLRWPERPDRFLYFYVNVFRANPANPAAPEVVLDGGPRERHDEITAIASNTPPSTLTLPGSTFVDEGLYAVVLTTMNRNNISHLAGAGSALLVSVE